MTTSPVADPRWVSDLDLQAETQAYTSWLDIHDFEKFTMLINAVKVSSPGNVTFVLVVSMDNADDLNKTTPPSDVISGTYDKLIVAGGVDAPASSVAMSSTGYQTVSVSLEDTIRSCRLGYISAATTNTTNYWTLDVGYSGLPRR